MKFTIERKALVAALGMVAGVVEARNTIPILHNVLLKVSAEGVEFTGTDLDMCATAFAAAQVDGQGATTVEARRFFDIAKALPEGEQCSLTQIDDRVEIRAGRAKYLLHSLPAADFPILAQPETNSRFTLPSSALLGLLIATRRAHSTEEVRYYLRGVFLHIQPGADGPMLVAAATDGHRAIRAEIATPADLPELNDMIVGTKAVDTIIKLLAEAAGNVAITCDRRQISVEVGDFRMTSKLVDGTFPDYSRVFPTANDKRVSIDTASAIAAMRRMVLVSSDKTRVAKLSLDRDRMVISCMSPEHGTASEEVPCGYDAAALELGVNHKYFVELIETFGTPDLHLDLIDSRGPILLTTPERPNLRAVLMPMRV